MESWPARSVALGVLRGNEVIAVHGDPDRPFPWASVSKLATTWCALGALEEGLVDLDEPAGPAGATVRHLLAHASGLPTDGRVPISRPGERRIYSNSGIEIVAELIGERAGMPFKAYFEAALRLGGELHGSPASGFTGSLDDLLWLAAETFVPSGVGRETVAEAIGVQFPGLAGVLPGFGRMEPNDWGLGFELRNGKSPHWTGERNSPRTFGHFGRSGTFLWVDPEAGVALACLTDLQFGDWAKEAWPALADAVLADVASL